MSSDETGNHNSKSKNNDNSAGEEHLLNPW
jgi:hypothetical protein